MTQDIEAIFFDMGGTITGNSKDENNAQRREAIRQIMTLIGSDGSSDEFDAMLLRRAKDYKRWSVDTLRELLEEQLWARWMLPDWPSDVIEPLAVQLNQLWHSARGDRPIRPDAGEVILELNRRGYRLGLISNTTSRCDAPRVLEKLGVSDCFGTVVLSTTFGWRKPDPSIFLEATQRLGVRPDRSAYVGDRPDRDVSGARQAGFAMAIIIHESENTLLEPSHAPPTPDRVIRSLGELLAIFPPSIHSQDNPMNGGRFD